MSKQKPKTSHYFRYALGFPALLVITVVAVLSLVRAGPARAAPGTNEQLNYQARLLTAEGAVVADGQYNIEFKIYQDGDGVLGGGDETLKWTETRSGANQVTVKNGYFSVYLGSVTPFGTNVDWNQDTLWLSVNVGGTGGTPSYDGEMSPFTRLGSTPYAINSSQLGGLDSGQFVQLAQSQQTDDSANASIHINDTGGGNLLHLLSGGTDAFTVNNSGTIAAATALETINGIIINNGAISGVDGFTQDSGNFDASASTGTFDTPTGAVSLNGNTSVTGSNTLTVGTGLTTLGGGLTVSTGGFDVTGDSTISGSLSGLTSLSSTGTITFDSFSSTAGLLKVNASGVLSVSTAGTDYEVPLTFSNGLTRTANAVTLGGSLTGATTINQGANDFTFSGTGQLGIGGSPQGSTKLEVYGGSNGAFAAYGTGYSVVSSDTSSSTYGYLRPVNTSDTVGYFELGAYDLNGTSTGARPLILNSLGGNVSIGTDTTPDSLLSVGSSSQFQVNSSGAIAATTGITSSGNINTTGGDILTSSVSRLTNTGALQNITGLTVISGGANITGGIDNNSGGITEVGALSGVTTISASGNINTTAVYQVDGTSGINLAKCGSDEFIDGAEISGGIITDADGCANDSGLSDERVKENITSLGDGVLTSIRDVNVVNFNFDCSVSIFRQSGGKYSCDETKLETGVIAQELAQIFPDLVTLGDDGYYRVNYDGLSAYNLKAVQEIAQYIDSNGNAELASVTVDGTEVISATGRLENLQGLEVIAGGATITGGDIDLNVNGLLADTNINTGASTGTVSIGGGLSPLSINSTNFDVSTAGAVSGLSTLSASGNISTSGGGFRTGGVTRLTSAGALQNINGLSVISGGASIGGGSINLNVGGLLADTNINTGASTGTVTIGGGLSQLVINSTAFDVTSGGQVTANGNVRTNGAFQVGLNAGESGTCTGNNSYLQDWTITGGIITAGECRSGGLFSDRRLKKNIVRLGEDILADIREVNTVNFDFKCEDSNYEDLNLSCDRQTGIIAQELAELFPELVKEGEDGYLRVDYDALNVYTLKAVSVMAQSFHNDHRPIISNSQALQDYEFAQTVMPAGEWLAYLEAQSSTNAEIVSDRISAVRELIAPKVVTGMLRTSMISTGPNGLQINLSSSDGKFALVDESGDAIFEVDSEGNAYFAGKVHADNSNVLAAVDTQLQALLNQGIVAGGWSAFHGGVDFHAMVSYFDQVVFAEDVTFQDIVTFSNDTGGFATILEGDTEVRIEFSEAYPEPPVVNVSNTDGQFVSYSYSELDETGFTIVLEEAFSQDVQFSWTAFSIDNPRTEVSVSEPDPEETQQ